MDYETMKAAIEAQFLMGHCVPAGHLAMDRITIVDWSWHVDQVRQQLHVPLNSLWDERILKLEAHGLASFCFNVAPVTHDAEGDLHEIPGWEDDSPREDWGSVSIHPRGVLALATLYGRPYVKLEESPALLANGSRIVSLPGTEATIRGYSGVRLLVIDEAARVPDDLYYSVRPMLAVSGGRLVALSTPFGKRGWFHQEYTEGHGWERIKISAHDCPRIGPDFLEEERRSLPAMFFASEYMVEFTEAEDSVFTYEHVQAALSTEVQPLFGGTR